VNQSIALALSYPMDVIRASGLLSSLCTFQAPSGVFDDAGAADGNYSDVIGLQNIPCMAPPPSDARIQATEVRALSEITSSEMHHVLLNGYYPTVDLGWRGDGTPQGAWRMMLGDNDGAGNLINGFAYMVMGVESDSQEQQTRIEVKLATL
jgi:hypothetical protein